MASSSNDATVNKWMVLEISLKIVKWQVNHSAAFHFLRAAAGFLFAQTFVDPTEPTRLHIYTSVKCSSDDPRIHWFVKYFTEKSDLSQ